MGDGQRATPAPDGETDAPVYSYWRVWVDGDAVRVARDWLNNAGPGPRLQPQHLAENETRRLVWKPHFQGGPISSVPLSAFTAWLDQGGAASAADRPLPGVVDGEGA